MFYAKLYKNIIYPFYHQLKQDNVWPLTKELNKNQWKTLDELQQIQQAKLKNLLIHAFTHVPYYKKIAEQFNLNIENFEDYNEFCKIPILTKNIIKNNLDYLISKNLKGNRINKNSTSGSTGEALYFFTDSRSQSYRKASVNRSKEWAGFYLGNKQVKLWGAPMDIDIAKSLRGKFHSKITNNLLLSSYDLAPNIMDQYVELINNFKPALMVSYPGPLEVFAKYLKKKSITFPSIISIITSAEQLFEHQRKLFKDIFKAQVYNRYGCREFGDIAQECSCNTGLHVSIDRFFVEILNKNGKPAKKEELGELFITDLDNFGMPMIRYQIGDMAAWSGTEQCPCKRGLPLLSKIEGRSLDVVQTPDNLSLGGTFWTLLFRTRPGIRQFQIVQEQLQGITVNYIPDDNFKPDLLKYFENRIQKKCGKNFIVTFKHTNKIQKTASGKNRIIVSSI